MKNLTYILLILLFCSANIKAETINGDYYVIYMSTFGTHQNILKNPEKFDDVISKGKHNQPQPRDNTHYISYCNDAFRRVQLAPIEDDKQWLDSKNYAEFIGNNIGVNTAEPRVHLRIKQLQADWYAVQPSTK